MNEEKKKSNVPMIIGIGCIALFLLVLLVGGGCLAMLKYGADQLLNVQLPQQLKDYADDEAQRQEIEEKYPKAMETDMGVVNRALLITIFQGIVADQKVSTEEGEHVIEILDKIIETNGDADLQQYVPR